MGHLKRLLDENPHGICIQYVDALQENATSQETAMNTAKDKIRELEKAVRVLRDCTLEFLETADHNHSDCDWQSDTDCRAERHGEGTAEQHRVFRDAEAAIATTRKWDSRSVSNG